MCFRARTGRATSPNGGYSNVNKLTYVNSLSSAIIYDMQSVGRYRIPSTAALVAFESAARHRSFSRAAQELGTFQSAISRQIAALEQRVSARLFERSSAGVTLTDAGVRLRAAVVTGLDVIHQGVAEAEESSGDERLVIACSHEASQLVLLPRYNALCEKLGERVQIRVLTYDHDIRYLPPEPVADVVFTWNDAEAPPQFRVPVLKEAVKPVCSPAYAEAHADVLNGTVSDWDSLTLIENVRPSEGRVSWDDWFMQAGHPRRRPRFLRLDNYIYVLEAAAAGRGVALGCRGLLEQSLASGALVALEEGFVEFDSHCYCALTAKGQGKPLAHECLAFFDPARPTEV